jgi:predicted glycosyltransferase
MNILMYSHDTYGLGHIRRSMALAMKIRQAGDHNIIILTGSPIVGRFEFPLGIDFIRVLGMIKENNELYVPYSIKVAPEMALTIRQDIILATAKAFKPSLFLVDKAPLGLKGEILPTLEWLHAMRPETHVVLGLRDIMDSAASTIGEWRRKNVYGALERLYSEIWVYGRQDIYDPISEYEIPGHIADKIRFTGYIPRQIPLPRHRHRIRKDMSIDRDDTFILVTAGGGGDGHKIVNTYLTMLENSPGWPCKSMIVTGPLLATELYDALAVRARKLKVRICKFHRKMEKAILAADCVVSMGGYNTMCEIVEAATPSLIIPRSVPREEQLIRARLFAAKGLLEYVPLETVEPDLMRARIDTLLANSSKYQANLRDFPMTAFETIQARINAIGAQA